MQGEIAARPIVESLGARNISDARSKLYETYMEVREANADQHVFKIMQELSPINRLSEKLDEAEKSAGQGLAIVGAIVAGVAIAKLVNMARTAARPDTQIETHSVQKENNIVVERPAGQLLS